MIAKDFAPAWGIKPYAIMKCIPRPAGKGDFPNEKTRTGLIAWPLRRRFGSNSYGWVKSHLLLLRAGGFSSSWAKLPLIAGVLVHDHSWSPRRGTGVEADAIC